MINFSSPEIKIKKEHDSPSKFLNLHNISSYRPWSDMSFLNSKRHIWLEKEKNIKPFQQNCFQNEFKFDEKKNENLQIQPFFNKQNFLREEKPNGGFYFYIYLNT